MRTLALLLVFVATACHASPIKVALTGVITHELAVATVQAIQEVREQGNYPLLEINTPGGSVEAGFLISKELEAGFSVCVVDGIAASMGTYILQSCRWRIMTRRSVYMMHQVAVSGGGGNEESLRNVATALATMQRAMCEHLAARTKLSVNQLLTMLAGGKEVWWDWEHALYFGAIDAVVGSTEELGVR